MDSLNGTKASEGSRSRQTRRRRQTNISLPLQARTFIPPKPPTSPSNATCGSDLGLSIAKMDGKRQWMMLVLSCLSLALSSSFVMVSKLTERSWNAFSWRSGKMQLPRFRIGCLPASASPLTRNEWKAQAAQASQASYVVSFHGQLSMSEFWPTSHSIPHYSVLLFRTCYDMSSLSRLEFEERIIG